MKKVYKLSKAEIKTIQDFIKSFRITPQAYHLSEDGHGIKHHRKTFKGWDLIKSKEFGETFQGKPFIGAQVYTMPVYHMIQAIDFFKEKLEERGVGDKWELEKIKNEWYEYIDKGNKIAFKKRERNKDNAVKSNIQKKSPPGN